MFLLRYQFSPADQACAAEAEVAAKDLFLRGRDAIAEAADRTGVAALWVTDAGDVAASTAIAPHVVWWA